MRLSCVQRRLQDQLLYGAQRGLLRVGEKDLFVDRYFGAFRNLRCHLNQWCCRDHQGQMLWLQLQFLVGILRRICLLMFYPLRLRWMLLLYHLRRDRSWKVLHSLGEVCLVLNLCLHQCLCLSLPPLLSYGSIFEEDQQFSFQYWCHLPGYLCHHSHFRSNSFCRPGLLHTYCQRLKVNFNFFRDPKTDLFASHCLKCLHIHCQLQLKDL